MLKGAELLAKVKELGDMPKSELVRACGYVVKDRVAFTQFEGLQPMFGEYRNDRLVTCSLVLTKRDWDIQGFSPSLSVTRHDNVSSIDLYSFQRWQVLVALNGRL